MEKTANPSIKIHINKIEKKTMCTIKTGYYLELLTLKRWNYLEALEVR